MNLPALYTRANQFQRGEMEKIINEHIDFFQSRSDGKDSFLDIGCGPGDGLMDFTYPILPATYTRIVGTDISTKMIQYARKTYADKPRVSFEVLDIETDRMPLDFHNQFDRVTSFFCLNWVQNQRQALENIYNTLSDDGECLIVFVTFAGLYAAYEVLGKDPKWYEYMKDMNKYIPPSQNEPQPEEFYKKLFNDVGFVDYKVEIHYSPYTHEEELLKDHFMSLNPFVERMPINKRKEHINALAQCCKDLGYTNKDDKYLLPCKVLVAHAKKSV